MNSPGPETPRAELTQAELKALIASAATELGFTVEHLDDRPPTETPAAAADSSSNLQ